MRNLVKVSTTSESRLTELAALNLEPFIVDIGRLPGNCQDFLRANILVINIPSTNINGFIRLLAEIEKSTIEKVLFVSSTSVYENGNKIISESRNEESVRSPWFAIENLFRNNGRFQTTIVRFGGLIGYSRNPGKFFSKGRAVENPESYVNLIHRDDCIGIIGQIVKREAWDEDFNCCAETHPTKREFYTRAARISGNAVPEFVDTDDWSYKIISNQKVRKRLNYEFLHPDLMKIKFE